MQNRNSATLARAVRNALLGSGSALALLAASAPAQALDVEVGGYIKADFIYDFDQDLGDTLSASSVATGDTESDPSFRAHAKQTRFNLSASNDDYSIRFEADLFTGDGNELVSNSRHLRLRHAYAQAGKLLIGQTWSTFMDKRFIAYPSTVDFAGPAGVTFVRQTQIRYAPGNGFEVALENPETRILGETARDTTPDLVARYDHSGDRVNWFIAGVLRQFEVAGGANDGESTSDGGINLGVSFNLGGDTLAANAVVNGGRYTYYGFANPEAVIDNGSLETVDEVGLQIFYEHNWGGPMAAKTLISYGMVTFDDEHQAILGANAPEEIGTFHINYRWSPYQNVNYGIELSSATREDFSGEDGDATRLQFGAQYVF